MERLKSRERADAREFEPIFAALEKDQGYVSRSLYMLARDPALVTAVGAMHDAAWYGQALDEPTRDFAAYAFCMFRNAAYSAAHCATNAERHGLAREKIVAISLFRTHPIYTSRDRALLAFCRAAGSMPGAVDEPVFRALTEHFSADEILALTALMAMMSFLTTWNAAMATVLEPIPRAYAEEVLAPIGWTIGQHGE